MAGVNERPTQAQCVLQYLKTHKYMTQRNANYLGIMRLASRISELRTKHGIAIKAESVPVNSRWGKTSITRYSLDEEQPK